MAETNDSPMKRRLDWRDSVFNMPSQDAAAKAYLGMRKAIERPVKSVADAIKTPIKNVADEIAYQLKPITIEDEAAEYRAQNDPYYHNILVGGCLAGGKGIYGISPLPFGVLAKGNNKQVFRNGQIEQIRNAIEEAKKKGKHVRVAGHSWGGADVARMAKDYPDVPFYALDPVSWTGRLNEVPSNLSIFRPREGTDGFFDQSAGGYLATRLGGQWPKIHNVKGHYYEYTGGHSSRNMTRLLNYLVLKEWVDRLDGEGGYDEKRYGIPKSKFMEDVYYKIRPEVNPNAWQMMNIAGRSLRN